MKCFVVFVGGKFLKDVESVEEKAKKIAEEFNYVKPLTYFYESFTHDRREIISHKHFPKVDLVEIISSRRI